MSVAASPQAPSTEPARRAIWQAAWVNTMGRFLALVIVFLFFAFMVKGGKFYSSRNLENIARQSAVYAIAAVGMTLVIISGGIDLSIGSIIALTDVVLAWALSWSAIGVAATEVGHADHLIEHWPLLLPILAVVIAILAATLAGFINGAIVVGLRLVPFIVTLGTMGIIRGIAKGIAGERDIYPPKDTWINTIMDPTLTSNDAARSWMLLPPGIWLLIVSAAAGAILLRYTRLGRHIFAVGSSEDTARLCGVPVERTKIIVYMLAGLFGGLAGVLQFSFISGIGQPTTAISYELFVIAAVVIGGGSLLGGEGSILGSLIGALIITILYMGGQQMGWPKWVQETVIGGIIIAAVALDRARHRSTE
jgi:ribose transport system permease protein/erythritol transport system permease protein